MEATARTIFRLTLVCWFVVSTAFAADPLPANRNPGWGGNAGVEGGFPTNFTQSGSTIAPCSGAACTSTINTAIANAGANTFVLLGAGTFTNIGQLFFTNKVGATLRGLGPGITIIRFTGGDGGGGENAAIKMTSTNFRAIVDNGSDPAKTRNWTAGYTKGTTTITLSSTTGLAVGYVLVLDQLNDPAYGVTVSGSEEGCGYCGRGVGGTKDLRMMSQYTEVTNIVGNDVTINPPLYIDYNASLSPQAYWWGTSVELCGIESMTLDWSATTWKYGVRVEAFKDVWVNDVKMLNLINCVPPSSCPGGRAHFNTSQGMRWEVWHSHIFGTRNGGASQSYGVESLFASAGKVENTIIEKTTTGIMTGINSGNAYLYNYILDSLTTTAHLPAAAATHAAHSYMNLFEGNHMPSFNGDFIHGSASHNVLARNRMVGWQVGKDQNTMPVAIYSHNRFFSVLGNILGKSGFHNTHYECSDLPPDTGCGDWQAIYRLGFAAYTVFNPYDAEVKNTIIRKGNWNAVNNTIPSSESLSGDVIPDSYYYVTKPFYFGDRPWPTYDATRPTQDSPTNIPAGYRYVNGVDPPTGPTPTPTPTPAATPILSVNPSAYNYGAIAAGTSKTQDFVVSETNGVAYSGNVASDNIRFQVTTGGALTIPANGSQTVTVSFNPVQLGNYSGLLNITSGPSSALSAIAYPILTGLTYAANAGVTTPPFSLSGNDVSQASETTDPTLGGRWQAGFTIASAGFYYVDAVVNAPNGGSNSIFLNVDAEPTNPDMIWDIPVTSGFESRRLRWNTIPPTDPKTFDFTAGQHYLIIRGREANTAIRSITLTSLGGDTPTPTPTPTPPIPPVLIGIDSYP